MSVSVKFKALKNVEIPVCGAVAMCIDLGEEQPRAKRRLSQRQICGDRV